MHYSIQVPKKEKSEKELLGEISKKIDKLIAIVSLQGKTEDQQLAILKELGFTSKEASVFTGISYSSIRHRSGWK